MGACERVTNRCSPLRLGRKLARGQRGQAMVEFVIVFPVFLLIILGIMQISLLMTARTLVNYAAFCAARSAMVYLPGDYPGAQPDSAADTARRKAHHAAAVACMALMPPAAVNKVDQWINSLDRDLLNTIARQMGQNLKELDAQTHLETLAFNNVLDLLHGISNENPANIRSSQEYKLLEQMANPFYPNPRFFEQGNSQYNLLNDHHILDRYVLANLLTSVRIKNISFPAAPGESQWQSRPREDLTATVTCFYPLMIPIIDRIIYFFYIRGKLLPAVDDYFAGDPDRKDITDSVSRALDGMTSSGNLNHYLLPLEASWTFTAEGQPLAAFFERQSGKKPGP